MKIKIPQNCSITDKTVLQLKKQIKYLINNYDERYKKEYKIYLYSNFLKINYKNHNFNITLVEYNNELFWYIKPFYNNYLLIKYVNVECFDIILLIIQSIIP